MSITRKWKCALNFYFVGAEVEWIHFMNVTVDVLQLDPFL